MSSSVHPVNMTPAAGVSLNKLPLVIILLSLGDIKLGALRATVDQI
jgi:hypothetical protein